MYDRNSLRNRVRSSSRRVKSSRQCSVLFSSPVIFKKKHQSSNPLDINIKAIIDSSALFSDELTFKLVKDKIAQDECKNWYILDSFPRTIPQAEMLESKKNQIWTLLFETDILIVKFKEIL